MEASRACALLVAVQAAVMLACLCAAGLCPVLFKWSPGGAPHCSTKANIGWLLVVVWLFRGRGRGCGGVSAPRRAVHHARCVREHGPLTHAVHAPLPAPGHPAAPPRGRGHSRPPPMGRPRPPLSSPPYPSNLLSFRHVFAGVRHPTLSLSLSLSRIWLVGGRRAASRGSGGRAWDDPVQRNVPRTHYSLLLLQTQGPMATPRNDDNDDDDG